MSGPWIMLAGLALVIVALGVGMNTSMGGTRSDHDDSSGLIAGSGALVLLGGAFVLLSEIFQ